MSESNAYRERRRAYRKRQPEHLCGECRTILFGEDTECLECSAETPADGWPTIGDDYDRYLGRVVGKRYLLSVLLGTGTTGSVYRAESLTVSRSFAIKFVKVPPGDLGTPHAIDLRIEREIEALSILTNPHVVRVFELIEIPPTHVGIVMDYVEGMTLAEEVKRNGAMAPDRACCIVREVATGLHEAHEASMIHRDIKPENIILEQLSLGGEFPHILDFGLVHLVGESSASTGFVGTPSFASPEQAKAEQLDRRSDIYSLGAVLYFLLMGHPPYPGTTAYEVLKMHCTAPIPELREREGDSEISKALERLVRDLLAKKPSDRPQTLSKVIERLDEVLAWNYPNATPSLGPDSTQNAHPVRIHCDEDSGYGEKPMILGTKIKAVPPAAESIEELQDDLTPSSTSERDNTGSWLGITPNLGVKMCRLRPDGRAIVVDFADTISVFGDATTSGSVPLYRASQGVTALAVSERCVQVGLEDGTVESYCFSTNQTLSCLDSPQGERVIAIGANLEGTFAIWANGEGVLSTGHACNPSAAPCRFAIYDMVTALAVSHDGDLHAVALDTGLLQIAEMCCEINPVRTLKCSTPVTGMSFSTDGHIIALLAPELHCVFLHYIDSGLRLMTFDRLPGTPRDICFTRQNELIVLCEVEGWLVSWDLNKDDYIRDIMPDQSQDRLSSPDHDLILPTDQLPLILNTKS